MSSNRKTAEVPTNVMSAAEESDEQHDEQNVHEELTSQLMAMPTGKLRRLGIKPPPRHARTT